MISGLLGRGGAGWSTAGRSGPAPARGAADARGGTPHCAAWSGTGRHGRGRRTAAPCRTRAACAATSCPCSGTSCRTAGTGTPPGLRHPAPCGPQGGSDLQHT